MEKITAGVLECFCDAFLLGPEGEPLYISFFDRSAQNVRAVGASLLLDGRVVFRHRSYQTRGKCKVFYAPIVQGKERFTHAIALAENLMNEYVITEDLETDLYYYLMHQFDLPLLREWIPEVVKEMRWRGYISDKDRSHWYGNTGYEVIRDGKKMLLKDLQVYKITLTAEQLSKMISQMLKEKTIYITKEEQQPLHVENLDDYFTRYGASIVANLQEKLHPITDLNGEISRITLKKTRPYPQQSAMVNGVYAFLHQKRKGSCLFVMGTGTGKTIQSLAAAEMLSVGKWLEQHPGKTLKDAYASDGVIHYRHVVMCPGHLQEKWKSSIEKDIPYAKAVIIKDLQQLVDLRAAGCERKNGKEFYIISKDFSKLSYQRIPTVKREGTRPVSVFRCMECQMVLPRKMDTCPSCGSGQIRIEKTRYKRSGLICPYCNRLLYKPHMQFDFELLGDVEDPSMDPLQWTDFTDETTKNEHCYYCGESLWGPFVRNINTEFGSVSKEPSWIRQTFWTNQARKGKKTLWIMKGKEADARLIWGKPINSMDDKTGGCRKYAPAQFIKKHLKGFFDVFIADEVHKAKGGSTAQGNAFHAIMKSSRYVFGLSGSIAGGVAADLFYLLFRLYPKRMIDHGYGYHDVLKFSQEYGCVEQDFQAVRDVRLNKFSRGKQLSPIRTLPGISPLVFSEFLLDTAVFLDINDMSSNMPPLYETIVLASPPEDSDEAEVQRYYHRMLGSLSSYEREYKVNLSSIRHQLSMSYLDKPYGVEPIRDPRDGTVIIEPRDYASCFCGADGELLAKEKKLLEILKKELQEGRNCVVYAEYTQSDPTNVLPRLSKLIKEQCGLSEQEVVVMKAGNPQAIKREHWMHEKAREGMKVLLCNPRLCETGLDFCWDYQGTTYNFPTLLFYQCGYSLFVVWQAAGRSWRLNQREECRTYYLACQGTVQQAILQVLGEKKSATAAIQGRFSADGLSVMAKGVDTQVRIAQIMNEMDTESGNRLQEMFDVIMNPNEGGTYGNCQKMKLFEEIIKKASEDPEQLNAEEKKLFSAFSAYFGSAANIQFGNLNAGIQLPSTKQEHPKKRRKKKIIYEYEPLTKWQ